MLLIFSYHYILIFEKFPHKLHHGCIESTIKVGCRLRDRFGPLVANPNSPLLKTPCRVRDFAVGTELEKFQGQYLAIPDTLIVIFEAVFTWIIFTK